MNLFTLWSDFSRGHLRVLVPGITARCRLQSEGPWLQRAKISAVLCVSLARCSQQQQQRREAPPWQLRPCWWRPPLGFGPCRWSASTWRRTAVWRERAERRAKNSLSCLLHVVSGYCKVRDGIVSHKETFWTELSLILSCSEDIYSLFLQQSSCTFLLEPDWLLELLSAVPLAGLIPSPVFSSPVVSSCLLISAAVEIRPLFNLKFLLLSPH